MPVLPVLAIMARVPRPGVACKTRLAPVLDAEQRLALYRAMLEDRLAQLSRLSDTAQPWVAVAPPDEPEAMRAFLPAGAPPYALVSQDGDDLGARLERLVAKALVVAPAVCVVDSDTPTLPDAVLREAFDALAADRGDVVLGPSSDGGYYLVGLREPAPSLFRRMTWSTSTVAEETRRRAAQDGLRVHDLAAFRDVDEPDDLRALDEELGRHAEAAPHTARALRGLRGL